MSYHEIFSTADNKGHCLSFSDELAKVMRSVEMPPQADFAFLGVVKLSISLEGRGGDLYKVINGPRDLIRIGVDEFVHSLDSTECRYLSAYADVVCCGTWSFFELPDTSLAMFVVSSASLTVFWPEELDWHHGKGILVAGVALTTAILESKNLLDASKTVGVYQVVEACQPSVASIYHPVGPSRNPSDNDFALDHFTNWLKSPCDIHRMSNEVLRRVVMGKRRGYICVQEGGHRTIKAFIK